MNHRPVRAVAAALLVLVLGACAAGSAVITGTVRTPVAPDQVVLYLDPPASFETIGLVTASSEWGWDEQESMNYAVAELKKQAAKLGANGVLILTSGETTSTQVYGSGTNVYAYPVTAKMIQGRAIYVADK